MSKSLVKCLPIKPPKQLQLFLEVVHLVGDEKAEDYMNIFGAIVSSVRPADSIEWLYVKDVVDLVWDIQRERSIKRGIIELMHKDIVADLLKTTEEDQTSVDTHLYRIFGADVDIRRWTTCPDTRKKINERLAARGFPPSETLARAFIKGAADIDEVERRIASCEARKMLILREIERWNERFSKSLRASADVVDAEFSEAAE